MTPDEARRIVLQSLPVFIARPHATWEQICGAIEHAGLSRTLAVEVGVFVPIAFGRALMASKFIAVLHSGYFRTGQQGERSLRDEPLFVAAYELAWELFLRGEQLTYPQFIAVAGRSAELNNVDRMLDQGSKFSDIMLGPAIITAPKLEDPGIVSAEVVE